MQKNVRIRGFTLIELLVVIGIIAILAAIVLVAINPARQFAQARNMQRVSDLNTISNAVYQNMADNQGSFKCPSPLPNTAQTMSVSGYNIAGCLVPNYLAAMPFDPRDTGASWTNASSYNTGYTIVQDPTTKRVTISAPSSEVPPAPSVITLTR